MNREFINRTVSTIASDCSIKIIYILGKSGTGKSEISRRLLTGLIKSQKTAFIEADPGQSSMGPPGTIGLRLFGQADEAFLRFIGDVNPVGNLLQTAVGIQRFLTRAIASGADKIVINSSGLVMSPSGHEFQFNLIDLIRPDLVIMCQEQGELEPLWQNFGRWGIRTLQCPLKKRVRKKTDVQRREYREKKLQRYFRQAWLFRFPADSIGFHGTVPKRSKPADWENRLIGFCDKENDLIKMGILRAFHPEENQLIVYAPTFEQTSVASIHVGTMRFNQE